MSYYCLKCVVSHFIDEEGQEIIKERYFYGKTKEEAEYKYRKYRKTSSKDNAAVADLSTENRGDLLSACSTICTDIITQHPFTRQQCLSR